MLQEKLRDGNLDPEELAIAAAAQVCPQRLPYLASSSQPLVSSAIQVSGPAASEASASLPLPLVTEKRLPSWDS